MKLEAILKARDAGRASISPTRAAASLPSPARSGADPDRAGGGFTPDEAAAIRRAANATAISLGPRILRAETAALAAVAAWMSAAGDWR